MAKITKKPKILTLEKVMEIEKILGLDGVHFDDGGNYLLTSNDGRIVMITELETIFSTFKKRGINDLGRT